MSARNIFLGFSVPILLHVSRTPSDKTIGVPVPVSVEAPEAGPVPSTPPVYSAFGSSLASSVESPSEMPAGWPGLLLQHEASGAWKNKGGNRRGEDVGKGREGMGPSCSVLCFLFWFGEVSTQKKGVNPGKGSSSLPGLFWRRCEHLNHGPCSSMGGCPNSWRKDPANEPTFSGKVATWLRDLGWWVGAFCDTCWSE